MAHFPLRAWRRPASGACLRQLKGVLIARWEKRARQELPSAADKPHYVLIDSLPLFIDELTESLDAGQARVGALRDIAISHAIQRSAIPDYTLEQIQAEYTLFRQAVFELLDEHVPLTQRERDTILDFVVEGRMAAVTEYVRLWRERESRALALAKESERRLRLVTESVPLIIWTARPDGAAEHFNSNWYAYTGLDPLTSSGLDWRCVVHPEDLARNLEAWREVQQTGGIFSIEHRLRRKDGEYRWFLTRARPLRDEEGVIAEWFGTSTDIDDQKLIQQALEQEREMREQFVSTLTHDLRNPLAAAKVSAQLIQRQPERADRLPVLSARISDSITRADRMIQNLLDVSRLRAGESLGIVPSPGDIVAMVRSVCEELGEVHGGRVRFAAAMGSLQGHWDGEELRRAIENLVNNAIKYGRPGGPVTVSVEAGEGDRVSISVHNEGSPIPEEERQRLFLAFQRGARVKGRRGWGIGLALVRGVAEGHGGRVTVDSAPGRGTTFVIELPRDARLGA